MHGNAAYGASIARHCQVLTLLPENPPRTIAAVHVPSRHFGVSLPERMDLIERGLPNV